MIWSLIRHRDISRELSKQMAFTVRCLCSIQCQEQQTSAVVFTIFGDIGLQLNLGHQPNETLKSPSQIPGDATSPAHLAAWHKPDRLRKLEDATFLRRTIAPPELGGGVSLGRILKTGQWHLYCSRKKNISRIRYNRVDKVTNDTVPRLHFIHT